MGKAAIKHEVFRPELGSSIRAVPKQANDSSHNLVPRAEPDDEEQTLANVTVVVADSGISLHGFNNVHRSPTSESGWEVRGTSGSSLVAYMLAPVRRAFAEHRRMHTFVINMDKGCFMPRPKRHTQKNRTASLLATLERQQVPQLTMNADGSVPQMVT